MKNIGPRATDFILFAEKALTPNLEYMNSKDGGIDFVGEVASPFDSTHLEQIFIDHVNESVKKIGIGENNIGIVYREIGSWLREGREYMTAFADQASWDRVRDFAKEVGMPIIEIQDPEYPVYDFYLFDISM